MKHRRVLVVAGLIGALALIVSLSVAAGSTNKPHRQTAAAAAAPPGVPNAKAIKAKYGGQSIKWISDGRVGLSLKRDQMLIKRFTKDTGIKVKAVPHPEDSSASYAQLARNFSSHSSSIDVMMLDVVWPGAFAPYLVNLKPKLSKLAAKHAKGIVENGTIGGKLVAMPFFSDFGILYYRTDLLRKYGYSHPPKTWAELTAQAKKIQAGERKTNDNFYGFVFQGKSYEGLTCDALEWVASVGGGHFIDGGKVSIDNQAARKILDTARGWVGTISPRGVTSYDEEGARNVFAGGNAAFLRNWPYAYAANQDSPVKGKFSVTVLPHAPGKASVGTIGGWELGISKYSKHKGAAIELVRYLSSPGVERFNAIFNSNVPTIPAVARDKAVVKVNPWLKPEIANVARVARPSKFLRGKYALGSKIIYQGVNQILNGSSASSQVRSIKSRLERLLR